jgi:hypothetical protein
MALKLDEILLLLIVLKCLNIEAADKATNETKPNIFGSATLVTSTGLSWTLRVATEWANGIIALHETQVVEGVAT